MLVEIIKVIAATIFGGYAAYRVVLLGHQFPETKEVEMTWEEYVRWQEMKKRVF